MIFFFKIHCLKLNFDKKDEEERWFFKVKNIPQFEKKK